LLCSQGDQGGQRGPRGGAHGNGGNREREEPADAELDQLPDRHEAPRRGPLTNERRNPRPEAEVRLHPVRDQQLQEVHHQRAGKEREPDDYDQPPQGRDQEPGEAAEDQPRQDGPTPAGVQRLQPCSEGDRVHAGLYQPGEEPEGERARPVPAGHRDHQPGEVEARGRDIPEAAEQADGRQGG